MTYEVEVSEQADSDLRGIFEYGTCVKQCQICRKCRKFVVKKMMRNEEC